MTLTQDLITKASQTHTLSQEELVAILKDDAINDELFAVADKIRRTYVGEQVHLRGLIEFSNICKNSCMYCGLRAENKNVDRYNMPKDKIIELAKNASLSGYKTVVLQSGESNVYSTDELCEIIKEIKKFDVAVTLSIGEKTEEEYAKYKLAGADRFLLRIETTDRNLYSKLHPNMSFDNRVKCLQVIKKLGYETGTGCLVGLPEQTTESLADDILFFKSCDADMVGIGPLIIHQDTPLKDCSNGNFYTALKVMALTRILMPEINIPATTAMETLQKNGRNIALNSGANVVMPNVTEDVYRTKYNLYPGKAGSFSSFADAVATLEQMGHKVCLSYGTSQHFKKGV